MKKIILVAGLLISFSLSAETMTNPESGEVWAISDSGAYDANNSQLIKYGDKYYGGDGRIYLRKGNILIQIGGPRQEQKQQPQKIQIQITAPPTITAPLIVPAPLITPFHHHHKKSDNNR